MKSKRSAGRAAWYFNSRLFIGWTRSKCRALLNLPLNQMKERFLFSLGSRKWDTWISLHSRRRWVLYGSFLADKCTSNCSTGSRRRMRPYTRKMLWSPRCQIDLACLLPVLVLHVIQQLARSTRLGLYRYAKALIIFSRLIGKTLSGAI